MAKVNTKTTTGAFKKTKESGSFRIWVEKRTNYNGQVANIASVSYESNDSLFAEKINQRCHGEIKSNVHFAFARRTLGTHWSNNESTKEKKKS